MKNTVAIAHLGWRKDADVYIRVHDSAGKEVDPWRSMTDFTWTKNSDQKSIFVTIGGVSL